MRQRRGTHHVSFSADLLSLTRTVSSGRSWVELMSFSSASACNFPASFSRFHTQIPLVQDSSRKTTALPLIHQAIPTLERPHQTRADRAFAAGCGTKGSPPVDALERNISFVLEVCVFVGSHAHVASKDLSIVSFSCTCSIFCQSKGKRDKATGFWLQ